jgi:Leu/Phe-tRNA-protein transferase
MLTQKYLQLDDEIIQFESMIKKLRRQLKTLRDEQNFVKEKILEEYTTQGVFPDDGLIIKKVPPKIIVVNEDLIPDSFWRVKRELDKVKINKACEHGMIAGVALDNGGVTLAIKAIKG